VVALPVPGAGFGLITVRTTSPRFATTKSIGDGPALPVAPRGTVALVRDFIDEDVVGTDDNVVFRADKADTLG
jgi:hypothetical protein